MQQPNAETYAIEIESRILHEGEINKVRYMP